MLVPTLMFNFDYYKMYGDEINENNLANLQKLYKSFGLTIPFDNHPIVPFGSMFWVRGKALKLLLDKNWQYSDFPEEPLCSDGTISHAIERFYSYIVQQEGYLSGYIISDKLQELQMSDVKFYFTEQNKAIKKSKIIQKFLQMFFSVKNEYQNGRKIKKFNILGFKIKFAIND